MTALIIILAIVILIALLLSVKVVLRITYADSLAIYLKILFVKIRLYPSKKREKKYPHSMSRRKAKKIKDSLYGKKKLSKKKKQKKDKKGKPDKEEEAPDLISIVSIVTSFVKSFLKVFAGSVRLKFSRLKIVVASEDAATTAITYGAVTQGINVLFPLLEGIKNVKKLPPKKELSVRADFLSDTPSVDIDVNIYIRVGGALKALLVAAARTFKKAVKDQLKRLERKRR